ncbi:MAG: hypothetical protein JW849_10435 [Phycisphaerae bacterium]|nr:hypothetical protein [Phycisphaerae bacterium]
MAKIERPIFFDADSLIELWGCGGKFYKKLCNVLQENMCVSEVVKGEFKGAKDHATGQWRPSPAHKITPTSVPRLVTIGDLSDEQYTQYQTFFSELKSVGPGERETFALAWVLEYDVCSHDTEAWDIFRKQKPTDSLSRHRTLLPLLRYLKIIQ